MHKAKNKDVAEINQNRKLRIFILLLHLLGKKKQHTNSVSTDLEKLMVPQLVKKYPTFYEIRRFITAFTTARHLSQFSATINQ
jgi:hypothetical protein